MSGSPPAEIGRSDHREKVQNRSNCHHVFLRSWKFSRLGPRERSCDDHGPARWTGSNTSHGHGIRLLVAFILVGVAVSVGLGVYGRVLEPSGGVLTTLGFWTLMSMKVTLGTAAMVLCVVQIVTAQRIFGRIGRGPAPRAVAVTHRISGVMAVLLSVPVAFHHLWSLGFGTSDARVFAHSLFGCVFQESVSSRSLGLPGVWREDQRHLQAGPHFSRRPLFGRWVSHVLLAARADFSGLDRGVAPSARGTCTA